jgi:Legionella pneumophila major outer membrane protein precursor
MKKVLPLLMLSCVHLMASDRVSVSLDAVYLKFYTSHDATRLSVDYESNANSSLYSINLHNIKYEPTWGIQGAISYKANYCDLVSKLQGFFFKNSSRPRTHMYPGRGYENNQQVALSNDYASMTNLNINPLSTDAYAGDSLDPFADGIMIDSWSHMAFNSLDLSIAPEFKLSKMFLLRPLIGLGGLIFNNHNYFKSYVQQGTNPVDTYLSSGFLVESRSEQSIKFNSIGPEIGFDAGLKFHKYLSLDVNATFRFLFGNKQTMAKQSYPFDSTAAYVDFSGRKSKNAFTCQGDYVLNMKLDGYIPCHKDKHMIGLSLGYKLELLPKLFTYAVDTRAGNDEGVDFMFQGLTAGAFYKF